MPRVSVLIPAYNAEGTLARALDSVAGQGFRDFETLVLDDGSTDRTCDVAAHYPGVRLISQPNAGVGAARQRLVEEASGEWIAWLDADDEWRADKLERQIAAAEETGAILVHSWFRVAGRDGREKLRDWSPPSGAKALDHVVPDNRIATPCVLVRREAMAAAGFRERLRHAEDWLAWLRLARLGPFHIVPEALTVVHEQADSASTPSSKWYAAERRVLEEFVLPELPESDPLYLAVRRKLGLIASLEGRALDAEGRRPEARARHVEALRTAPTKGAVARFVRHLMPW